MVQDVDISETISDKPLSFLKQFWFLHVAHQSAFLFEIWTGLRYITSKFTTINFCLKLHSTQCPCVLHHKKLDMIELMCAQVSHAANQ